MTDRQIDGHTDRQTNNRQTGRQNMQTDRIDRQTDCHIYNERQADKQTEADREKKRGERQRER